MKAKFTAKMRLTFSCLTLILPCLFIGIRVHGMNQYTYDIDSLVYMSPQVVEGTLGGEHHISNVTVSDFKISAVHKGDLKVGQTIQITALNFYSVAEKGFWGGRKLKDGDRFFFFGDRAKKTWLYDIPEDSEIYWSAPSGVWLITGEKALDFWQFSNPGPYVAVLEGAATNTSVPTVDEVRMLIPRSMQREKEWRPLLERDATTNDIPELLKILREECASSNGKRDHYGYVSPNSITEKACNHLISLHDVSALTNALNINQNLSYSLGRGFDSASGRQFIWSKITDETMPIEERIKWASFLRLAGEGTLEEHYLKQIAEYVTRPDLNPKLQTTLLDNLREMLVRNPFIRRLSETDADVQTAISEATPILESFSAKTDSEETKYRIDLVLEEFNRESPSVVSILRFDHYDAAARRLNYHYDISMWRNTNLTTEIVFRNVKSGDEQKMSAEPNLEPCVMGTSVGYPNITLPKDLPNGRYRVFYEFSHDGKVAFTSHYFETDF